MIVERGPRGLEASQSPREGPRASEVSGEVENAIRAELSKGTGIKATARAAGVGTVQRVKAEQAA